MRSALSLSAADRRWIDFLTQVINETWDDAHPEHPKTHAYMGSEEFIRLQFEEYLLALLSCMKYHEDLNSFNAGESGHKSRAQLDAFNIEGDPALEFNSEFLAQWQETPNYALFKRLTSDALLFSIVEPRHPCAGGLTFEDVQRRFSQQVAELHLDERVREGREALNRHLSTGQKKVTAAFNSFWSDIDAMRDAQRKKNEEKAATQSQRSSLDKASVGSPPLQPSDAASVTSTSTGSGSWLGGTRKGPPVDISQAQASVSAAGQKAGSYLSSWGTWASEKRKEWQEKKATSAAASASSPSSPSSPAVTSPSTPTLGRITEVNEANASVADRGRSHSMPRYSEESSAGAGGLSRSGSRRKRWSNILLRRESGEFGSSSPHRKEDGSNDSSEVETPYPRSPLSREAPILGDELPGPDESEKHRHQQEQNQHQQPTTERPTTRATTTTTTSSEAEADKGLTITELLEQENAEGSEHEHEHENGQVNDTTFHGETSLEKEPTTPTPLQSTNPNAGSAHHQANGEVEKTTTTS